MNKKIKLQDLKLKAFLIYFFKNNLIIKSIKIINDILFILNIF